MLTFLNIQFQIPSSFSLVILLSINTLPSHTLLLTLSLLTPSLLTLSLLTLSLLTPSLLTLSLLTLSLLTFRLFSDSGTKKKLPYKEKQDAIPNNETINIFSIASGHLYERFLRYVCFLFSLSPSLLTPSILPSRSLHTSSNLPSLSLLTLLIF